jgi:cupin 2 domain-containing protein
MPPHVFNIFDNTSRDASAEEFATLHDNGLVRIERIISHAQASAKDFWYDQAEDEWVLLLRGEATLEFEHGAMVELVAGSWLNIPQGTRHRVERTTQDAVWLAVHMKPAP